jgi:hypothetical protein
METQDEMAERSLPFGHHEINEAVNIGILNITIRQISGFLGKIEITINLLSC